MEIFDNWWFIPVLVYFLVGSSFFWLALSLTGDKIFRLHTRVIAATVFFLFWPLVQLYLAILYRRHHS